MNEKMWSGRFNAPLHANVEQFTASISVDAKLAYEDILGSMAHVQMLAHSQIISQEECERLHHGLRRIYADIKKNQVSFSTADEDIHMNVERLLTQVIGDLAKKLHTARSRNDQVALDMHLYLRQEIVAITGLLTQLQATLITQAERYKEVILPGYTHLQRAQPVRLAHHLLAYVAMFERDSARLMDCWQRVNQSPLGACALAGSSFAIEPNFTAKLLAFDAVYANSMDAVSDRDYMVEFLAAAALIMTHLSRLCEELIIWSSQEFNFIELADAYCTGSSIMPQKKNPDVPELIRGKTGRVYGALISMLTILKGLPLAYNKDLQEDKEQLFSVVDTVQACLSIATPLLNTLTVNAEKMASAVADGFLNATDLADYLARSGVAFRDAHHIVGKIVAYCIDKKCRLEQLSLTELQQFSPLIQQDIFQVLAIENVVEARNSPGGSSLAAIAQQLALAERQLQQQQLWLNAKQQVLAAVNEYFGLEEANNSPPPLTPSASLNNSLI